MQLRFKLDENLPRRVELALRELGHDVETALSEGLAGAPDPTMLAACTLESLRPAAFASAGTPYSVARSEQR